MVRSPEKNTTESLCGILVDRLSAHEPGVRWLESGRHWENKVILMKKKH